MRLRTGFLFLVLASVLASACSGEIVGGGRMGGGGSGGSGGANNPGVGGGGGSQIPPACVNNPSGGAVPCQVTAQCASPQICLGGVCQPPSAGNIQCSPDMPCATGLSCVGGSCQRVPGTCTQNLECPAGMSCRSGSCLPASAPPGNCAALPPPPDLAGLWHADSKLHFREALSGPLEVLLDAGRIARALVTGDLTTLGVPRAVSWIVGPLIASIVNQYVPPWGQQLAVAIGDVSDILNDMRVKSDVRLAATCPQVYRGDEVWTRLEFEYRGVLVSKRPEEIPEIGMVRPESFGGRVLCGELYVDKHRIQNAVGGLLRWVLNTVTQIVTCANNGPCYQTPEAAVADLVDCAGVAQAVDQAVWDVLGPFGPVVYGAVYTACENAKRAVQTDLRMAIDRAITTFSVVSLQGQAHIASPTSLDMGSWQGSLVGSDFPGEWSARK